MIDAEVKILVDTAHKRATQILQQNMGVLHDMASRLLEVETLGGEDLRELLSGVKTFQTNTNGYRDEGPSPTESVIIAPGGSGSEL